MSMIKNTNNPHRVARLAGIHDIQEMLAIIELNLIVNKQQTPDTLEQGGFLMHGFTAEYAEEAIRDKEHYIVVVALDDNEVVGYTLAFDLAYAKPAWQSELEVSEAIQQRLASEKVLYHRHIATKPRKKGVGSALLQMVLDEATKQKYKSVICQIAHTPYKNKISAAFHEKFGFHCVGKVERENVGYGVYLKDLK